MRILIVSDAWEPQINGVVRTYQNICGELARKGHEIRVVGPHDFRTVPIPRYPEIRLAVLPRRRLAKIIGAFAPDAIHIPVEGPLGNAARAYCRRHKIPFTTSFHTQFPDYLAGRARWAGKTIAGLIRRCMIAYVRWFHSAAHATFVATASLETQLRAWGFTHRLVRLVRGVRLDVFHPGPRRLFPDMPRPVQLYVGRVSVEKNIEAFLSLPGSGTKVVVGDGPALAHLQQLYPDVVFTGVQQGESLADHYRSADVFVFPSRSDTFGIVLIEALACGLPVAGYDVTGPGDIIEDDLLGAVGPDLGSAIARALVAPGTPADRHEFVRRNYDWSAVADIFIKTVQSRP